MALPLYLPVRRFQRSLKTFHARISDPMDEKQQSLFRPYSETVAVDSRFLSRSYQTKDSEKSPVGEADPAMGVPAEDFFDSMILVSGSRLVQSGLREMDCRG